MPDLAKLLAAQVAVADIAAAFHVVKRIASGNIQRERLPLYFLSPNDAISTAAKLRYSGQPIGLKQIADMKEQADTLRDSLRDVVEEIDPDFSFDVESLAEDFRRLLDDTQDELVTIGLIGEANG